MKIKSSLRQLQKKLHKKFFENQHLDIGVTYELKKRGISIY
jgi:hypothetical protein